MGLPSQQVCSRGKSNSYMTAQAVGRSKRSYSDLVADFTKVLVGQNKVAGDSDEGVDDPEHKNLDAEVGLEVSLPL